MKAILTRMWVVIATLVVSPWRLTSNTSVPILDPLRMMSNTRWTCLGATGAPARTGTAVAATMAETRARVEAPGTGPTICAFIDEPSGLLRGVAV